MSRLPQEFRLRRHNGLFLSRHFVDIFSFPSLYQPLATLSKNAIAIWDGYLSIASEIAIKRQNPRV